MATDEPGERGGTNLSATPLETLLSSFLGCTTVITHCVAGLMGIEVRKMDMKLVDDFDTRGVFGKAEVRVPVPDIKMHIILDTDADAEAIERLRQSVAETCPVSVILREAGCRIDDTWVAVRPQ